MISFDLYFRKIIFVVLVVLEQMIIEEESGQGEEKIGGQLSQVVQMRRYVGWNQDSGSSDGEGWRVMFMLQNKDLFTG